MGFFKNKIRKLNESDIDDVIELYADTCKYNIYFQEMFNKQDCKEEIKRDFAPDVAAAIRTGLCLGCFEKGKLIGCILSVDWFRYFEEEHALFKHMFDLSLSTTHNLVNYMNQFSKAYFVFAIGVADGKRCQGNATALIKHYVTVVPKDTTIVSDCMYPLADAMWLSHGFIILPIGDGSNDKVVVKIV